MSKGIVIQELIFALRMAWSELLLTKERNKNGTVDDDNDSCSDSLGSCAFNEIGI